MIVVVLQLRHELVHLSLPGQVGQLRVEVGQDRGGQERSPLQLVQLQLVQDILENKYKHLSSADVDNLLAHLFFGKFTPSKAAWEIVLSEEGWIAG